MLIAVIINDDTTHRFDTNILFNSIVSKLSFLCMFLTYGTHLHTYAKRGIFISRKEYINANIILYIVNINIFNLSVYYFNILIILLLLYNI